MESPIKFDLSRLSYPAVLLGTIPLIPGGVFVCGALFLDLAGSRAVLTAPVLSAGARVAVIVFSAHTIGLVLHFTSYGLSSSILYGVGYAFASSRKRYEQWQPWRNKVWRKAARAYLGALAPDTDEVYYPENQRHFLAQAESIEDPDVRRAQQQWVYQHFTPLMTADFEWSSLHWVLRERFPYQQYNDPGQQSYTAILATLYSVGWTAIILLAFAPRTHWLVWAAAILSVLAGLFGDLGRMVVDYHSEADWYANRITARILAHLKDRSNPDVLGR